MTQKDPVCRTCGDALTDDNWNPSYQRRGDHRCAECMRSMGRRRYAANHEKENKRCREYYAANIEKEHERGRKRRLAGGMQPMHENKECSLYLGVHVAERMLSEFFDNVERMPPGNVGYDFICSRNKKIDVKASCTRYANGKYPRWGFDINKNMSADYFLCIAFDNRDDLNPMHVWLIPGEKINHLSNATISNTQVHKWDEYKLPIDGVVACCDALRS